MGKKRAGAAQCTHSGILEPRVLGRALFVFRHVENRITKSEMIRAVLIDLSGTLHIESQPINAGAVEAITRLLRSSQFQVGAGETEHSFIWILKLR